MWLVGGGCGYWVESMGVVIRRWGWLERIDVVGGCCCKEVYRIPHITYLSPLVLALFCSSIPASLFIS